jgi:hypothetical protein
MKSGRATQNPTVYVVPGTPETGWAWPAIVTPIRRVALFDAPKARNANHCGRMLFHTCAELANAPEARKVANLADLYIPEHGKGPAVSAAIPASRRGYSYTPGRGGHWHWWHPGGRDRPKERQGGRRVHPPHARHTWERSQHAAAAAVLRAGAHQPTAGDPSGRPTAEA